MKKIISAFILFAIIFTMSSGLFVFAADSGMCGENAYYSISDGKLTISGSGAIYDYAEKDNFTPWKAQAEDITSITIEEGITRIGDYSFTWFSSLAAVSLPSTLTSIGDGAFGWCMLLPEITFPNGVTEIGEYAFTWCKLFSSVTLPDKLESIEGSAFYFCGGITDYAIAADNKNFSTIDGVLMSNGGKTLAMYPCGRSAEVYNIPNGVTEIDDAFFYCSSLKYVNLPSSVEKIEKNAFYNAAGLEQVNFAKDSVLSSIGENAFYGCKNLGEISIPDGCVKIGTGAFKNCSALYCAEIPASVTNIAADAFSGCKQLKISVYANSYAQRFADENSLISQFYASVILDGKEIEFDQKPLVQNGRTLVPLRLLCEALGAEVKWYSETRTATVVKGDMALDITIDSTDMVRNGNHTTLDVPAQLLGSRTLVPLRVVSESFGVDVKWDGTSQKAILTTK